MDNNYKSGWVLSNLSLGNSSSMSRKAVVRNTYWTSDAGMASSRLISIFQNDLACWVSLLAKQSAAISWLRGGVSDLTAELSGLKSHFRATGISDSVIRCLLVVLFVANDYLTRWNWLVTSILWLLASKGKSFQLLGDLASINWWMPVSRDLKMRG